MLNFYDKFPVCFRDSIDSIWKIIPSRIKYGSKYRYYTKLLNESQKWSMDKHLRYQLFKLNEIVSCAKMHVPYYRKWFGEHNISSEIKTFNDFQKLPLLNKDIVEMNGINMINDKYSLASLEVRTTGGTTGKQLRFYTEPELYIGREYPFIDAIWGRIGYIRGKSRVAQIRNQVINNGLWMENHRSGVLVFDTYHLSDYNIDKILRKLIEWKAEFLHTYPSTALILCDYIRRERINFHSSLRAILVTSENLYPGQKETIEEYLQARCFTFYGHSEAAGLAGWCECSDLYHIQSEYGYIELVDEHGDVIDAPNIRGEIVCTGFDNFAMPFIRYRTGDYSSYADNQLCKCGRHYKLLNRIEGRWMQEMFIGKEGNKISMTALNMHTDIFKNVENYQFVQNEIGKCILKIVKNDNYSLLDEQKIQREILSKFDTSLSLQFEYVKKIDKTIAGKQRYIIQNVITSD